jgi:hypothetical protein
MKFETENIITLIIALLASSPAWITALQSWRRKKKEDYMDYEHKIVMLSDVINQLLSLVNNYDMILQKVFFSYPEINSDMKARWIKCSAKIADLRDRIEKL